MSTPSEWQLLARYLSGECSEEEQVEVETLIASDPEKQRLIASMSTVWDAQEPHSGVCDVSRLWSEIVDQAAIAPSAAGSTRDRNGRGLAGRLAEWFQPQPHAIRRYAVAAVLLVACSLVYYGSQDVAPSGNTSAEWVTLAVESGSHDVLMQIESGRYRGFVETESSLQTSRSLS